jgi:hypothetical protein
MPCAGPTPGECAEMEKKLNGIRYGAHASDLDIATCVACDLVKYLKTKATRGEMNDNLPPLASKWIEVHEALDAARLLQDKDKEDKVALANRALAKLTGEEKKALGLI